MIIKEMSDNRILKELGSQVMQYRLNKNISHEELAKQSGVSYKTITRLESGESVQLLSLMKILRALNLIQNMAMLLPEIQESPIQKVEMRGKTRKKAHSKKKDNTIKNWIWGEDK